jgi:hypothetical protein
MSNLFEKSYIDHYTVSIKYADSLLNLILDIIRRNGDACRYLRNIEDPLYHIQKFNDKNPIPRAYSHKQELFKKVTNDRVDKQLSEDDKTMLTSYSEYRLQLFKDLLIDIDYEEHITDFLNSENSIPFNRNTIYNKGDCVDYYKDEYKYWIEATISEDYGPVIQVGYKIPSIITRTLRCMEVKHNVKINKD